MFNDYFSCQCSLIINDSTLPDLYFMTDSYLNIITFDDDSIMEIIRNHLQSDAEDDP